MLGKLCNQGLSHFTVTRDADRFVLRAEFDALCAAHRPDQVRLFTAGGRLTKFRMSGPESLATNSSNASSSRSGPVVAGLRGTDQSLLLPQ